MNQPQSFKASVPTSILIGVLSVGAALGVSNLVAGIVNPPSTPFLAVGNAAIDRTPKWLREFGITTFGANDKPVLLLGVGIAMVILGVVAGLISRRSAGPGVALVALLGVVGLLAVQSRPDTTTVGLVSPVVAAVAGVATLVVLRRAALGRTNSPRKRVGPATALEAAAASRPEPAGSEAPAVNGAARALSRRGFLGTSAGVAVVAGAAGYGGQQFGRVDVGTSQAAVGTLTAVNPLPAVAASADFSADKGLPFITSNQDFYRVDTALGDGPALTTGDWSLRIHGMVDREITISFADLIKRPLIEKRLTFTCISYVIGSQLVSTADWVGVSLADLITEAGPQAGAEQILSMSSDGYTASTPLPAVIDPTRGAMLAVNMNGEPLPQVHGFPVRMIVPGFYGYCSATKWLVDIEVTTFAAKKAYWTTRDYAQTAPVKTGSKIVFPKGLTQPVPTGMVTATGAAWSQPNGISKVEVQFEDGPWMPARLGDDEGPSTWRMWRIDLPNVAKGNHFLSCRAYDGKGRLQTAVMSDVLPDGQSGLHRISFSAM